MHAVMISYDTIHNFYYWGERERAPSCGLKGRAELSRYIYIASVPGLPRSVRVLIMCRLQTFEKRGRSGLKYHVG